MLLILVLGNITLNHNGLSAKLMSLPIPTFLGQAVYFSGQFDHFELTRLVGQSDCKYWLGVGFLNDGMGVGSKIHWLHTKIKGIPIQILQRPIEFGHVWSLPKSPGHWTRTVVRMLHLKPTQLRTNQ